MAGHEDDRGEYRPIFCRLLNGPEFRAFDAVTRAVFYPLKLRLPGYGIGAFPGMVAVLSEDSGYDALEVARAIDTLEAAGWLEREGNVVWLVRGLEFEPTMNLRNANHRTYVERQLRGLPSLPIVARFRRHYELEPAGPTDPPPPTDTITDPIPKGMGDTLPDTIGKGIGHGIGQGRGGGMGNPVPVPVPVGTEQRSAARAKRPGPPVDPAELAAIRSAMGELGADALDYFLEVAPNPFAVVRDLKAIESGMHPPAYPWPTLGRALHELRTDGAEKYNSLRVGAFCRRLTNPPPSRSSDGDSEADELANWARKGGK